MYNMFDKIQKFDQRVLTCDIPILLCGDMNSTSDSTAFSFMNKKPIKPHKSVRAKNKHLYDIVTADVKAKNLVLPGKFMSSYSLFPHPDDTGKNVHKFPDFTVYAKDV